MHASERYRSSGWSSESWWSRLWARLSCLRHGGHLDFLRLDVDRMRLECLACGRKTPGWSLPRTTGLGFWTWRPKPTSSRSVPSGAR